MKRLSFLFVLLVAMCLPALAADSPRKGKLVHMVSFKFKETASKEQIKQVEDAFRDLKKKIKEIQSYEWGTNISHENHDKGFTHAFVLSFKTEKDRDAYIAHPDHKAFGKMLGPILGDVFVLDFWAEK
ncbi:MAG TPA: Dabb family protein [Candidatus Saccharimonadales bacterium]|nr:Dabb family protein [Candidatus Saccharimonadales bacterium]